MHDGGLDIGSRKVASTYVEAEAQSLAEMHRNLTADSPSTPTHRDKIPDVSRVVFPAFVAKKLSRKEVAASDAARQSLEAERVKLTTMPWPKCPKRNPTGNGKGTWDITTVIEKKELMAMARKSGETIHIGRVCILGYMQGVCARNQSLPRAM